MRRTHARLTGVGLSLSLALAAAPALRAQTPPTDHTTKAAPDNTKVNKSDQLSADSQKNNRSDLTIARDIRRSIVAEKGLSTYAHNVKVISENGQVTLKGPVRNEDERKMIAAKAAAVVGAGHVANELTVAPSKN